MNRGQRRRELERKRGNGCGNIRVRSRELQVELGRELGTHHDQLELAMLSPASTPPVNGSAPPARAVPASTPANGGEPFTCPRCGAVSHNPNDREHGYCGRCHDFTAPPALPENP